MTTKQQLEKENELLRKEIEFLKKEIDILKQQLKKPYFPSATS
jgi:cell division protein FtsB